MAFVPLRQHLICVLLLEHLEHGTPRPRPRRTAAKSRALAFSCSTPRRSSPIISAVAGPFPAVRPLRTPKNLLKCLLPRGTDRSTITTTILAKHGIGRISAVAVAASPFSSPSEHHRP